jgi:hypothetical protein
MEILKVLHDSTNFHLVCKLLKSIYSLCKFSQAWYQMFGNYYLISKRFTRTKVDSNNKHKLNANSQLITIYMDDCVFVNNSLPNIVEFKAILFQEFDMIYEGQLHYYINNQIIYNKIKRLILLNQTKHLHNQVLH